MARTKSSRGVPPFKLRSGESPLPLFKGLRNAAKNLFNKTPVGMIANAVKGGGGGSIGERLDRIEQKLDQAGSEAGSADAIAGNQNIDPAELAAGKAKKAAMSGGDDEELLQTEV